MGARRVQWAGFTDQPRKDGRATENRCRSESFLPKLTDTGIAGRLAELAAVRLQDERVMQVRWRTIAAEQSAEMNLPAGGRQQVLAPDDDVDALLHVVHHDGELVGPLAEAVAHEKVTTLRGRLLRLRPKAQVIELLDSRRHA